MSAVGYWVQVDLHLMEIASFIAADHNDQSR
jgi:hypothetical protein